MGHGGNANVCEVIEKTTRKHYALKELKHNPNSFKKHKQPRYIKEKEGRFLHEIEIMSKKSSVVGILPILDYSKTELWYVMPIAVPITDYVSNSTKIDDIVKGIIDLAETLSSLHAEKITHRDIKPNNILIYNNRYCLSDFGLVDFPDRTDDLTGGKALGPIFTMAPEMRRDPKHADGEPSDIYSLAKTMWILLSGIEKGFDGPYNILDKSHSLRFVEKLKNIHLAELDELLSVATNNDPKQSPSIFEFKNALKKWLEVKSDYKKAQESEWAYLTKLLFGQNVPSRSSWDNLDQIVNVLKIVTTISANTHMFFPSGGGLDFRDAEFANESGCIYLIDSFYGLNIIKPKHLHFISFKNEDSWNYFYIETEKLHPILGDTECGYEYLVEDYPSHYVSAQYADYGVYDYETGLPLPNGSKLVRRYFNGNFLIVLKNSVYNHIGATYDGRHSRVNFSEFTECMETLKSIQHDPEDSSLIEQITKHLKFFSTKSPTNFDRKKSDNTSQNYFKTNYTDFDFSDLLKPDKAGNICFSFNYNYESVHIFAPQPQQIYLCKDGSLKPLTDENIDEAFILHNRELAIKLQNDCSERLRQIAQKQGLQFPTFGVFFDVNLKRSGKPLHLFTKDEIKILMQNADDRVNNQLVIDENGYAKIIQNICERYFYPVRLESWDSGNNYVGKYSSLSFLDECYRESLEGWLDYLRTGRQIYKDYTSNNLSLDKLVSTIQKFY